jgi:hypothetical protein
VGVSFSHPSRLLSAQVLRPPAPPAHPDTS